MFVFCCWQKVKLPYGLFQPLQIVLHVLFCFLNCVFMFKVQILLLYFCCFVIVKQMLNFYTLGYRPILEVIINPLTGNVPEIQLYHLKTINY